MSNLYMDDNDVLEQLPGCDICYARHRSEECRFSYTTMYTPKLVEFRRYLMCRKQAIDNNDEGYMLVGDFVPSDCDENVKPVGDDPPLLNERVLAKYYKELAKLDPNEDMLVGDYMYWDGFKQWGYYPLERVIETDFSLPVDLNCGPIFPPDESSTVEEEPKMYEGIITIESNKEVVIDENESSMHSLEFIDCLEIDFVIRPNEMVEIFIVEFDSDGMRRFYVEKGRIDVWRTNEEWMKAKRIKMGRASKAYFLCP